MSCSTTSTVSSKPQAWAAQIEWLTRALGLCNGSQTPQATAAIKLVARVIAELQPDFGPEDCSDGYPPPPASDEMASAAPPPILVIDLPPNSESLAELGIGPCDKSANWVIVLGAKLDQADGHVRHRFETCLHATAVTFVVSEHRTHAHMGPGEAYIRLLALVKGGAVPVAQPAEDYFDSARALASLG